LIYIFRVSTQKVIFQQATKTMEFITNNKNAILKWYNKQMRGRPLAPEILPHDEMTETRYVKQLTFKLLEKYDVFGKPCLVNVVPMLRRNECYENTRLMSIILNKNSKKYRRVLGYNITACRCGLLWMMELHSLLQHIESGKYIDLTIDFNHETRKWFVPLTTTIPEDDIEMYSIVYTDMLRCNLFSTHNIHKCNRMTYTNPYPNNNLSLEKFATYLSYTIEGGNGFATIKKN
jgi:hypothetical protein